MNTYAERCNGGKNRDHSALLEALSRLLVGDLAMLHTLLRLVVCNLPLGKRERHFNLLRKSQQGQAYHKCTLHLT